MDFIACGETNPANNAVPNRLRVLRVGMGVADGELPAVVHAEDNVVAPHFQCRADFVKMRCCEAVLFTDILAVYPHLGFPNYAFERELYIPVRPAFGNFNLAAIPYRSDVGKS